MSDTPALGSYETIRALASDQQRPIVDALHQLILRVHKEACVLAWPKQKIASYGIGPRKMTDHYAYIAVHSNHTNLGFYRGTSLTDPTSSLEGTGKKLRHVKIHSLTQIRSPAITALVEEAMAERTSKTR